jgi:uncharacterized protein
MPRPLQYYFLKKRGFQVNTASVFVFIALGVAVLLVNVLMPMFFPTAHLLPYLTRNVALVAGAVILIAGTRRLLGKNAIIPRAAGLQLSRYTAASFASGIGIGMFVIVVTASVLRVLVPFHFERGTLTGMDVLKEAHSYFWGNLIEELLFRGFPLIVLSHRFGWRKAVWIMALPFGLFHLWGLGFSVEALKMVLTTATYSFVFSYAFLATGTLWTPIGIHVASNILIHAVVGLDGMRKSFYVPVFDGSWPAHYDAGLISFITVAIFTAIVLYLITSKREPASSG